MPKNVIYNGVSHSFPDEATEDQIKQALGITSAPAASSGGSIWDTISNLALPSLQNFNPVNLYTALRHPVDTVENLVSPLKQWADVPGELRQGRYTDAANSFAGGIPIIGPASEAAHNSFQSGQISKGIGQALGPVVGLTVAPEITSRVNSALLDAVGPGLQNTVGSGLKSAGVSTWKSAAKIPETITKKTGTYRETGNLAAGENEIANTLLGNNTGTIRAGNVNTSRTALNTAGALTRQLKNNAAAQGTTIPLDPLLQVAENAAKNITDANGLPIYPNTAADLNTISNQYSSLADLPTDIPIDQSSQILSAIYKKNSNKYGRDVMDTTASDLMKDVGREIKDQQNSAVPGLEDANAEYSALKPATAALSNAVKRAGHLNPFTLTDLASAVVGHDLAGPWGTTAGLLSQLRKPLPMSFMAQQMYNLGDTVGSGSINNIAKAVLGNLNVMRGVNVGIDANVYK